MKTQTLSLDLLKSARAAGYPTSNCRNGVPPSGNRSWRRMLAVACCGALPATSVRADTAYEENFEGGISGNWSGTNLPVSQATGTNTSWYLGGLGNDTVSLPLTGLNLAGGNSIPNTQGRHVFTTVSYDLFVIGGWTGNNDNNATTAHTFAFETSSSADTTNHGLTTTFSNLPAQFQAFPYDAINDGYYSQPGGKGAKEINTLGFSGAPSGYNDAVYRLAGGRNQSFTFDHDADDLTLDFSATNLPTGAIWGLTNVKIVTGGVFNWQAMDPDGLNGGWEVGGHWANPDFTLTNPPGPDDLAQFTAAGNYDVSIHAPTSVGFLHFAASTANASTVQFNTIGHTLTLTAGDSSNVSLAVADGSDQTNTLFVFNSNNDADSDFNGVINAETVGVARGTLATGTLTLDGFLDPAKPGTNGNDLGNVILNVQREMSIGDARYHDEAGNNTGVGTLNILYGAILNSGLGGGSASSNAADGNTKGFETQLDGTVNVNENGIWNQTGSIWCGVSGAGALNVTSGSQINVFELPFAGQTPAIGGGLTIGGFAGSSGAVTVKDADSQLNVGEVKVANREVDASIAIDNFGTVNAASVKVGADVIGTPGSAGNALIDITHQGLLKVTSPAGDGQLTVGDAFDGRMTLGLVTGNNGSLFNTGQATVDFAVIGRAAGISGQVDVAYAQTAELHSLFTVNKTLTVGDAGDGAVGMNGGGVTVVLGQDVVGPITIVGSQAGSHGVITMGGGAGSDTWAQGSTFDASAGGVVVGDYGLGRLEMAIGGQAFANTLTMAQHGGSVAELLIDGDGSDNVHTTLLRVLNTAPGLVVGQGGTSATVEVFNGALLDTFCAAVGGQGGDVGPGTVMVRDLRDPATLVNHEIGSLWLVHGVAFEGSTLGGTLAIGGTGLGNPLGGNGSVTIGSGGRLGVECDLQLGTNGRLDVTGGAVTVGSADPLVMGFTPNSLHVVSTAMPGANSTVSGGGVIAADVTVHGGGNLGPNNLSGSTAGTLTLVGSLRELSAGNLCANLRGASAGSYDTFALRNAALTLPAGTAILDNGAGITLIGRDAFAPTVGDHFDVLTAASIVIGTLNITPLNLPATGWHYGVVSVPGGQALRIQYGAAVHEPGSVAISGTVRLNGSPISGLLVTATPGFAALTNAAGHYTVAVPTNATGTVVPSASGLASAPAVRSFTDVTADLAAQDFELSGSLAPALTLTTTATSGNVAWTGIVGVTYQPETSTNLVDWTDWGGPLPGTNGPASVSYRPDQPKRFFRVRCGN